MLIGVMGERDLPKMAVMFLAKYIDLCFSKCVPCNTSSIGCEKALCQKQLYPQIRLRNSRFKQK